METEWLLHRNAFKVNKVIERIVVVYVYIHIWSAAVVHTYRYARGISTSSSVRNRRRRRAGLVPLFIYLVLFREFGCA